MILLAWGVLAAVGTQSASAGQHVNNNNQHQHQHHQPMCFISNAGGAPSCLPQSLYEENRGPQSGVVISHKKRTPKTTLQMSTLPKDYYDRLGIRREATRDEVKQAYRHLSHQYHPDWNKEPDAEMIFTELNEAYNALMDEHKRRIYDEKGEEGLRQPPRQQHQQQQQQHGGGAYSQSYHQQGGGETTSHNREDKDLGVVLNNFFKGASRGATRNRRRSKGWPGGDIRLDLSIPFRASMVGAQETVRVTHLCECNTCSGSGIKPGSGVKGCNTCAGMGAIISVTRTPLGSFQTKSICPKCSGSGQVVEEFCGVCAGQGRAEKTKNVKIAIPPGVGDGQKLRIRHGGDAGLRGGEPGDLHVYITVENDPAFTRRGFDLHSDITVNWLDCMLGGNIQVPLIDGTVEVVALKEGTQPGTTLRLEGRGVPKLTEPGLRGDLFLTVEVTVPQQVGPGERQVMEQLREVRSSTSAARSTASSPSSSSSSSSTTPQKEGKRRSFFRRLGFSF